MKSKKALIPGVILFAAIVVCIVGYAVNGENIFRLFQNNKKEVLSHKGEEIVAIVDGEKITRKGFDSYKNIINSNTAKLTDKQVLDKIIESQVIYNQAVKEGLKASDKEVDKAIKTAQDDLMKFDDQQYNNFKKYIGSLNMSEDEYWESVKPNYEKTLIRGKYRNSLKEKYSKDGMNKAPSELDKNFNEYYNKKIKDLISKAKIQILIK